MKKYISYILIIFLMIVTFYYSDEASLFIINKSKLMKDIKENSIFIAPVESIIDNNYLIVGINGLKVNELASYYGMQSSGVFDMSKLVYNEIYIKESDKKYIIKGSLKNAVALIIDNKEIQKYASLNNIEYSSKKDLLNSYICFENDNDKLCSKYIKTVNLNNQNFVNYSYDAGNIVYIEEDLSLNNFKYLLNKLSFYNIGILKIDNLISGQRLK